MKMDRAREIYNNIIQNGISAIDDYLIIRTTEELFLDFKRSADNGKGKKLDSSDRKNLSKAISGFGNSEGGVIVWGIDCSKDCDGADVAKAKMPLENVDRFISLLQNAILGCTLPPHNGVENYGVKEGNDNKGYAITLIPKSLNSPHQATIDLKYYMRTGSNFSSVTHGLLSGMFGRRPQPRVCLMLTVVPAKIKIRQDGTKELLCKIGIMIRNNGQAIARDSFLNAEIIRLPSTNCTAKFNCLDKTNWLGSFAFNFKLGLICNENYRIAPSNFAAPVILNISICPPFESDIKIDFKCGCERAESTDLSLSNTADKILKYYNKIINLDNLNKTQELVGKLLGIEFGKEL